MALDSIVGDAVGFVLIDRVVFAVRNVVGHVGICHWRRCWLSVGKLGL